MLLIDVLDATVNPLDYVYDEDIVRRYVPYLPRPLIHDLSEQFQNRFWTTSNNEI